MKSYTDIEQSRKLADILPLDSADMYYDGFGRLPQGYAYTLITSNSFEYDKPCWSLAALLNTIRKRIGYTLQTTYNKNPKVFMVCELGDKPYSITSSEYDNEVDACVEIIIKLKEHILL